MIIARDSRFAAVVIHSRIRVEIKHKVQGKTQNGIDPCYLLRDGGIDNEGVIANPDCRNRRQRYRRWKNSRGLSQRQGKVTALLLSPPSREDAFVKAYSI